MKDNDFKQVFEIYEILASGRIDMAKKMMEKFLGINPDSPAPDGDFTGQKSDVDPEAA